jgi:DNA-directed RNA polymerase subunit RPC12/RpoP
VAASRKIVVNPTTYVSCPTCSWEIIVRNTSSLPREFSVLCPKCGGRKLYQLAQIHDQKQVAETTQISRRTQFGMKREIDSDPTAGNPVPEKSRLGGFASWLLQ